MTLAGTKMDFIEELAGSSKAEVIRCIEMHTTGEATRIVYQGFPELKGTLLEQREQASKQYDHVRKRLMLEPRGHYDMYGAILRPNTELTVAGEAHMGVLFCHNEGFSTMCGHATIALGRLLVDTHDLSVFPKRNELAFDSASKTIQLTLHAPCGAVRVTVPATDDGQRSDGSRKVSFMSVPSFAASISLKIPVPPYLRWPQLSKDCVTADIAYGGTFYCLVTPSELGFKDSIINADLQALQVATAKLKKAFNASPANLECLNHPTIPDVQFLYSVVVVDSRFGEAAPATMGSEMGLCFFADSQLDRSPTGSAVSARVALAYAKGDMQRGDSWTYHSLVSNRFGVDGAFVGKVVELLDSSVQNQSYPIGTVLVEVQGKAFYTGSSSFILEDLDILGKEGFTIDKL